MDKKRSISHRRIKIMIRIIMLTLFLIDLGMLTTVFWILAECHLIVVIVYMCVEGMLMFRVLDCVSFSINVTLVVPPRQRTMWVLKKIWSEHGSRFYSKVRSIHKHISGIEEITSIINWMIDIEIL
jgi:hypothetical protein